jgi:hypothetical protein
MRHSPWAVRVALLSVFAVAAAAEPASARVTVRVETSLRDQNVHVAGVWIGRHGGAWFGQTLKLARRLRPLTCVDDDTANARLLHRDRAVFEMAGLALTARCWRDAVEWTTVRGRRDRVRMEFGTVTVGRRTPAAVRRRLTYLSETAASVTYGVSRMFDPCHPGHEAPKAGWQVTLTVSKTTHKVTSLRVFSGSVEVLCP